MNLVICTNMQFPASAEAPPSIHFLSVNFVTACCDKIILMSKSYQICHESDFKNNILSSVWEAVPPRPPVIFF